MTATVWPFIELDGRGIAYVEGTRTRVTEVAVDHTERQMSAEEIQAAYPYLSLPQIHAALGFYYDHRAECDRQLDERREKGEGLLDRLENPALQNQLRRSKAGE